MMGPDQHDYLFKMLLIGNSAVGKSCLLVRYAVSSFVSDNSFNRKIHSMKTSLIQSESTSRSRLYRWTIKTSNYRYGIQQAKRDSER
jgi:GTPase SAR1 family protein